ncbi:MAG: hypothetical protein ABIH76_04145 [Candidatus Bathyarchaeota archaeon]
MDTTKYVVDVIQLDKPLQISKEKMKSLKGVVKGRLLSRMKMEAVDCPVVKERVAFLICFTCDNNIRRVKGKVECKGNAVDLKK